MSLLDKIASTVLPPEKPEDRAEAHAKAKALANGNDWLARILSHHEQIEQGFANALNAANPDEARRTAKELATLLTAHSSAEEAVVYPALVIQGHKSHAATAYEEHQMTKVQLAELERLPPLSDEWREKLEHIRAAVLHHIYTEEKTWLPEIVKEASSEERALIDARFNEEFDRSMGKIPA